MRIRVLGSVEAIDESEIALGGMIQRRLLAVLAMEAGDVVSLDRLVELTWPDGDAPAQAERNIRTYVHRLRVALGADLADRIETVPPGYRLRLIPGELDARRLDELAAAAARMTSAGDWSAALDLMDEADGLWQGRPFGEFADEPWTMADGERLTEIHLGLRELRGEVLTEEGRFADAIGALEELTRLVPLRERPRALLMQALYQAGRQVEALRAFQDFRTVLVDEVGVEPTANLVALDRAIAAGELPEAGAESEVRSVGGYELHEQIGEGAFAVVYRGTQTGLDRDVAIKAIRAELANRPEFIRRFEAEAHMVARLEHPHIVPLYDYWREPDRAYLVMRWLPGGTLESSLADGPWTPNRTASMVQQVGSALAVAHRAGIVHRDVKAANIILDGEGNTFLSDFGIALEAEDRSKPESALSEGSPAYASPEQLRKEPVGPPADIHGLAIVAYEALTAELPFADSPDPATALNRQLSDPIPRLSGRLPAVSAQLDAVLQKATAKDPAGRYQRIDDFVDEFVAAVESAAADTASTVHRRTPTIISAGLENPYKGLRAFDEADAADFHGRERLVDELLTRMNGDDGSGRLLTVVGPSGSGKSSVVRAGLLPALRAEGVEGSADWFITTMSPGAHPFEELETALLRVAVNPPASLLEQLSAGPRGILRGVRRVLPDNKNPLLIVIDQFEELFTLCDDEEIRGRFLAGLGAAVTEPRSPIRVVLTLRADFYDRPLRYGDFAPLIKQNMVTVTPLAGDELEHAIVSPAARVGVEFEAGLVAQIVAEVASQPGALPLLQYALTELFEANISGLLLLDRYRAMGGISGALARRADELYRSASPDEQAAIRDLFGRLVTLGEGIEDTRRRARLSEVALDSSTDAVIETYGSARLLTFDRDPLTREPTAEVAHEALIREWPRLREWLDDDREGLRMHRHLTTSAEAWLERGQDDSELYRGVRLDAAEAWAEAAVPALNPLESEFLQISARRRDADIAAERNRIRRLRRLLVTTGVVAVLALVAGAFAIRQQRRADDQAALAAVSAELATENADQAAVNADLAEQRADEAEVARAQSDLERLRTVARSTAEDFPQVAALLAVEAHRLDPSVESLDALHWALTAVPGFRGSVSGGPYMGADLLDDGVTLVAVGSDAIDVWDLRDRELLRSVAHSNPVRTAELDSTGDGRIVVVRGELDDTSVFDLTTGEFLGSLRHDGLVNDLSISADGSRLAVALSGGAVEIWDLERLILDTTLDTGDTDAFFARWSPIEDRLAVVTLASEIQFWDMTAGELLWADAAPAGAIVNENTPFAFIFTSDGQRLAFVSGSLGAEFRVYDTADGSQPVEPFALSRTRGFLLDSLYWIDEEAMIVGAPSQGGVVSYDLTSGTAGAEQLERFAAGAAVVVFSSKLARFVIAGQSGLEFWSVDRSGPLEQVVPLTEEQLSAVANQGVVLPSLAADGSQLFVSVFALPTAPPTTLFNLETDPLEQSVFADGGAITVGFGAVTLFATFDGGVELLDSENVALGPPVPFPFDFTELGASPDGRYFAFGRLGGFADLYTGAGEFVATVAIGDSAEYEGAQTAPSFSSDGEYMSVLTTEGGFGLWTTDPVARIEVPNPGDWISGLLMGEWLFVTRSDGSIVRVDPSTFELVGAPVLGASLAYSKLDAVNLRVAGAAAIAGVIKVWDLETAQQLGRDLPYQGGSARYEFTTDGTILSVPDVDRVTLWNFDTDTWADIACEFAGRNLTADEWEQLGPRTIERRATCPQYPLS